MCVVVAPRLQPVAARGVLSPGTTLHRLPMASVGVCPHPQAGECRAMRSRARAAVATPAESR
jgi:hypothetical protein